MRRWFQRHLLTMLFALYSRRARHSRIDCKYWMEDIRLLWRVQCMLHSRYLLLL
jgi:hypothetical protein